MAKIIKNTTASAVTIGDTGQVVPASNQLTINAQDFDLYAASEDIILLVADGTLVVNDGSVDLTPAQGIGLIQGSFIQRDFVDNLKTNNRLKVDVSGTLSDGTVKVTSSDQLAEPLNNKIASADSKLAISVINAGATEALLFTVQPGNINTADLNNDANFITSGQAPVQPSDIANFETSTELDARDVANRNRANHTGTQTASTISDFTSAVQSAETVTTLAFNSATNILTYTNEAGAVQTVDLTQYLDDTNLARIINGTLNPATGIITFTRDDSTTFTIDASALLDDQDASEVPVTATGNLTATDVQQALEDHQAEIDTNTAKVSADGSIDTHSDVDVTTNTPATNDVLQWDGSNFVPASLGTSMDYTVFAIWAEESGGLANNSRQWSFGNGSTGDINIVLPIDAELFAVSFDYKTGSGTASIDIFKNNASLTTTKAFSSKDFETLAVPQSFTAGDYLGFRTNTESVAITDARVAAWFRIRTTPTTTAVLNDLLDVSLTTLSSGQALVYNGSGWANQTIFDGDYNNLSNLPTLGTAADNNESDFATAAQGTLASSAVQPGDNVSDLTNDAGYVNTAQASAAAPVQPSDIANFETSTELNVRDTNNRNRANHTGTQTASTISDFTTAVQAAETTTSLSFDNGTKILSYVNEDGSTTNVDLNQFLDDTNLTQIVSGSLNASTGIVTFTRDDASTFTVDFSPLNDQAAIATAINAHETTIGNHDDVDVTTTAPVANDQLVYNGTNWVPVAPSPSPFKDYVSTSAGEINQTTTYSPYLTLSTTVPTTGLYKISWSYTWSLNDVNNNFQARVQIDNTTTIMEQDQEPADSAGTGVNLPLVGGGTSTDSGTDQKHLAAGFDIVNLTSGAHTIELDYRCQVATQEAAIYRGILSIEEW